MPKLIDTPSPIYGKWHVGETRTFYPKDAPHREVTKTSRPFPFDWADAANEAHAEMLNSKGLEWVPDANGGTKLVRQGSRLPRTAPPAHLTPQSILQMTQREFNEAVDRGWIATGDDGQFVPARPRVLEPA